jgi:hypothetical protein
MSVYVLGYRTRKEADILPESAIKRQEFEQPATVVAYSTTPEWVIEVLEEAIMHCRNLNQINVHIGQHYCQFEIEKIDEDKYAIFCKSHPEQTPKN